MKDIFFFFFFLYFQDIFRFFFKAWKSCWGDSAPGGCWILIRPQRELEWADLVRKWPQWHGRAWGTLTASPKIPSFCWGHDSLLSLSVFLSGALEIVKHKAQIVDKEYDVCVHEKFNPNYTSGSQWELLKQCAQNVHLVNRCWPWGTYFPCHL